MAKQFFDAAITTEKDDMTKQDGSALTLTNTVRILYDDTVETGTLVAAIDRIKEKILETEH